jgi:hypothetical protein
MGWGGRGQIVDEGHLIRSLGRPSGKSKNKARLEFPTRSEPAIHVGLSKTWEGLAQELEWTQALLTNFSQNLEQPNRGKVMLRRLALGQLWVIFDRPRRFGPLVDVRLAP